MILINLELKTIKISLKKLDIIFFVSKEQEHHDLARNSRQMVYKLSQEVLNMNQAPKNKQAGQKKVLYIHSIQNSSFIANRSAGLSIFVPTV